MSRIAVLVLLVAFPTAAAAQPVLEFEDRGTDGKLAEEGINLADCRTEEVWEFSYSCVTCTNVAFFVGDNCDVAENRSGSDATCRELKPMEDPSAVRQELVVFAGQVVDPFDETHIECAGSEETTSVFVLDIEDSNDDATAFAEFEIGVDTDPPPAPSAVRAEPGEEGAFVEWTANADSIDDRDGFQVLCAPRPGEEPSPIGDAGAEADAGGETDGGAAATCGAGELVPGAEANSADFCGGRQGGTARSLRIGNLVNGATYEFAVIAYDKFENPSVLSPVDCTAPAPVVDFFEAYRAAGGQAGGGFCSAAPGRTSRAGAWGGAAALVLASAGFVRRRRRA